MGAPERAKKGQPTMAGQRPILRELISTQLGVPLEEQVRRQLPAHTLARVCR